MNSKNVVFLLLAGVLLLYQTAWSHTKNSAGLNPPPPGFYSCRTTGNGTVCQGKLTNVYSGGVAGSCPQGFDILENGYFEETATRYYDRNGYLVQRVLHVIYPVGDVHNVLYNSRTGKAFTYATDVTETDSFTIPGDFNSISARFTGNLYMVSLPATGMLFEDAGILASAPTGDVLDAHGLQVLLAGEAANLCNALG